VEFLAHFLAHTDHVAGSCRLISAVIAEIRSL
jgi:hypothetical protein